MSSHRSSHSTAFAYSSPLLQNKRGQRSKKRRRNTHTKKQTHASISRFLLRLIFIRKRKIDAKRTLGQWQGMQITRAKAFKRQPGWQSAEAYHLDANVFDPVAHKSQGSPVTPGAVEAVNNNIVAHDLFSTGATRARESEGSITVEAFSNCCPRNMGSGYCESG